MVDGRWSMVDGRWSMVDGRWSMVEQSGGLMMRSYRDLLAWQRAMDLVTMVYRVTRDWPKEELYGLTSQVRRAAVSVPANMAEGQGRTGSKELLHHLSIANGSLCEVQTLILIAQRLGYVDETMGSELINQTTIVAKPLAGLMKSLQ